MLSYRKRLETNNLSYTLLNICIVARFDYEPITIDYKRDLEQLRDNTKLRYISNFCFITTIVFSFIIFLRKLHFLLCFTAALFLRNDQRIGFQNYVSRVLHKRDPQNFDKGMVRF